MDPGPMVLGSLNYSKNNGIPGVVVVFGYMRVGKEAGLRSYGCYCPIRAQCSFNSLFNKKRIDI